MRFHVEVPGGGRPAGISGPISAARPASSRSSSSFLASAEITGSPPCPVIDLAPPTGRRTPSVTGQTLVELLDRPRHRRGDKPAVRATVVIPPLPLPSPRASTAATIRRWRSSRWVAEQSGLVVAVLATPWLALGLRLWWRTPGVTGKSGSTRTRTDSLRCRPGRPLVSRRLLGWASGRGGLSTGHQSSPHRR